MTFLTRTAHAKINLTLQVGPRNLDGYHNLHSVVAFATIGDRLSLRTKPAKGVKPKSTLRLEGPFFKDLGGMAAADNLVLQASEIFDGMAQNTDDVSFVLQKNLPIASGIGGGSADAAAAIKLRSACGHFLPSRYMDQIYALGSDIAVCLSGTSCVMQGRGEQLRAVTGLGQAACVLVNPGGGLSTGAVFAAYDEQKNTTDLDKVAAAFERDHGAGDLLSLARSGRNDLQASAELLYPEIAHVIEQLSQRDGCNLARMSGSGATCFGLFETQTLADQAARQISTDHPNYWCVSTTLGDIPAVER